jgi:hypothetical protein
MELPPARLRVIDLTEGDAQYCGRYLAAEAGRAGLLRLAGTADIVLESFSHAQAGRYRLAPDALRQAHPGLVVVSLTAFGRTGPYRDYAATGPVLAALGGVLSRSGQPGALPMLPPPGLISQTAAVRRPGCFRARATTNGASSMCAMRETGLVWQLWLKELTWTGGPRCAVPVKSWPPVVPHDGSSAAAPAGAGERPRGPVLHHRRPIAAARSTAWSTTASSRKESFHDGTRH